MNVLRKKPADRLAKPERGDWSAFETMARERAKTAPSNAEVERAELKRLEPERIQNLNDSGIRGFIMAEDFEHIVKGKLPKLPDALDVVQRWVAEREAARDQKTSLRHITTVALVGLTGRGKTVAGAWLIARVGGEYLEAEHACKLFRAHPDSPSGRQWQRLLQKRVLVVDDLGTETNATDGMAMLNAVVNSRAGIETGWTLLTANLTKEEFFERYDERTIRRIEHMGRVHQVGGLNLRRTDPSKAGYEEYLRKKQRHEDGPQRGPRERATRPMQQERLPEYGGHRRNDR